MRFWIYGHVATVLYCAAASVADSHGLLVRPLPLWLETAIGVPLTLSLFAIVLCPIAVLTQLLRQKWTESQVLTIVLAESLLTLAHTLAMNRLVAH